MFTVLNCIVVEHDPRYIAVALLFCVIGSLLSIRLFSRVRRASGLEKAIWLFLAGFVGGSTIWTTHFLAMLGYIGAGHAGYAPDLTILSFVIAVTTTTAGFGISAYGGRSLLIEAGGMVMGVGISAMHYTGMKAYQVQGALEWDRNFVVASLIFGAAFGAFSISRVSRPFTRYCKYGAALALMFAIVSMHFTAMGGMRIVFDPRANMPPEVVPPAALGFGVMVMMMVLLTLAAVTYLLDARTNEAAVAQYRHLSLHDPLTGIPNRAAFNEEMDKVRDQLVDLSGRVAVLVFDLNRFKEINDVHGHAAGDAVLREIGVRLGLAVGDGEFVARIGGDEFVAIKHRYFKRSEAVNLAKRLLAAICEPVKWNDALLSVGASVGIGSYPGDAKSMDDLVAQADVAMYRAKQTGDEAICFYDSSMDQSVRQRNALAMDMRLGLKSGQFELFYQPQNDTFSGEVIAFEVLLRWNHPTRGLVSSGDFIPIAERTGFIRELGEWVLRNACFEAVTWKNALRIAVNVAPQQLSDPSFPLHVASILHESGLAAQRLELETTESGIIADHQRALQAIRHLKTLGVKVAMDDYGTGYSSLSTLMSFPFDKIKIDRTFIEGVADNLQSAAIVRSTLILASSLNIPVLAEGVETGDHVSFLQKEGCAQVQGFFFGRPGPRSTIETIVNGGQVSDVAEARRAEAV